MARLETDGGAGPAGSRSAQNESFLNTSFLQGANAAYLEGLLDAYEADTPDGFVVDPAAEEEFLVSASEPAEPLPVAAATPALGQGSDAQAS